jgi:hypothetical protein
VTTKEENMDPLVRKRYLRELEVSKNNIGKNADGFIPDIESAPWYFSLLCFPGRDTETGLADQNER